MKLKTFQQFINESAEGGDSIEFDLVELFPERFSAQARAAELGDDAAEYTDEVSTRLVATQVETYPEQGELVSLGLDSFETEAGATIDPSFETEPVKIKLFFADYEEGFGSYGPYGGGHEAIVYCGIQDWSEEAVLTKFKELSAEGVFSA
jgi:hypothetical protein